MKKERAAFFENNASSYIYPENNFPQFQNFGMPYGTQSSSSYYQGPIAPIGNQSISNEYTSYNKELEERLSKIERQLNRFDSRLTKLESQIDLPNQNIKDNYTNNMYMI